MRRLAVVLLALVVCLATVVSCAPDKEKLAEQQRSECFANQKRIKLAVDLVHADTGFYPDIHDVVTQLNVKCPSGGQYLFDATNDTISCSVHGHP